MAFFILWACSAEAQPAEDAASRVADRAARAAHLRASGQRLFDAGDLGSAAGYFRDAISADPADAHAYEMLARVYLRQNATSHALEVLRAGLARRADHAPLWRTLSEVFVAQGQTDEAADALRELVARAPTDIAAHVMRAQLAAQRHAFCEALDSYRAIMDLAPPGDPRNQEARRFASALVLLVGSVDPVVGAHRMDSPVRAALSQ